ncbi:MAG: DUF5060 domain-containing protein [Bacilli bacterium]|nr:DUF5060 domain-containing protein [Bacilli bacterium]
MKRVIIIIVLLVLMIITSCKNKIQTTITTSSNVETSTTESIKEHLFASVSVINTTLKAYEMVEMRLNEKMDIKSIVNPYDYDELNIFGKFTSPTGREIMLPAFWYKEYEIILDETWQGSGSNVPLNEPKGLETVLLKDNECYMFRFLPTEKGNWIYEVEVKYQGEVIQTLSGNIEIQDNEAVYKGFIQVEPLHKRNFIFEDGSMYIPIGQNTSWHVNRAHKTYDYDVWFQNMHEIGANVGRIWLSQRCFSLHYGEKFNDFSSRQNEAARLDRVISLAEKYDIYLFLTLINHGQFSQYVNPDWHNNPWNVINGGILNKPREFFYSEDAKRIYKSQLLYLIGRYSYSTHIFAWELWNEVDWTDSNPLDVYQWHKEMSQFIKEHDPYHHLVTTSYKGETGMAYGLSTIDFVNPHSYDYANKNMNNQLVNRINAIWNIYQKPVIFSELGINAESGGRTYEMDPTGITIHQGLWASIMGGGAGGAMNWWWDSWVHPHNLYYRFEGAAKYSKLMDLRGSTYIQLSSLKDITISNNQISILGYRIDNRLYIYLYDKNWTYFYQNIKPKEEVIVTIPFVNGEFKVTIIDTKTGEIIDTASIVINDEKFTFQLPTFHEDIAIIVD